jgi:hypothetical protein
MGVSILDMSVSLDGYIGDADDYLGGDDGERLHKWADTEGESAQPSAPIREFDAEWKAAGAVLGTADCRAHRSLGRQSWRSSDLRAQSPAAAPGRPLGLSVGDVRERGDRERDGAGEGGRADGIGSLLRRARSAIRSRLSLRALRGSGRSVG